MTTTAPAASHAVPLKGLALLTLLTIVWGINWPLFKMALTELGPWSLRCFSLALGAGAMFAVARARGISLAVPRPVRLRLVVASMCNIALWNILTAYGVLYLPSGHAAVLGFSMPLWAAIIGFLFLGERLSRRAAMAVLLGTAGLTLLMVDDFARLGSGMALFGLVVMVCAANSWAVGTFVQKRTQWNMPLVALAAWQMAIGWVPIAIMAAILEFPTLHMPSVTTMALVAFIGFISLAVGMLTWLAIVQLLPVNVAAISTVIVPVVAVVGGGLILGEPLGLVQYAALLLTVLALALVMIQPRPRKQAVDVVPLEM
jgi:drug/metabolite transporter (DMT)-like permease